MQQGPVMRMHLMPLYQDEHCVYVQYRSDGRLWNLPLMSQSQRTVGFLYQIQRDPGRRHLRQAQFVLIYVAWAAQGKEHAGGRSLKYVN